MGSVILVNLGIGIFCDRQLPGPMHLEINNWQDILNIICLEAVRRNRFHDFKKALESPKSGSEGQ